MAINNTAKTSKHYQKINANDFQLIHTETDDSVVLTTAQVSKTSTSSWAIGTKYSDIIPTLATSLLSATTNVSSLQGDVNALIQDTNQLSTDISNLQNQVDAINSFSYVVVASFADLPTPSEETMYKIYLVPDNHSSNDVYDEYLTIKTGDTTPTYKWEKIGNTDIDLSYYMRKNADSDLSMYKYAITFITDFNSNIHNTEITYKIYRENTGNNRSLVLAAYNNDGQQNEMIVKLTETDNANHLYLLDFGSQTYLRSSYTPKDDADLVNKKYVDDAVSEAVPPTATQAKKLDHTVTFKATGDATGSATASDLSGTEVSIPLTLKNSGVTAGSYTAVTVNAKGIVTAGGQSIAYANSVDTAPSSLAIGGTLFVVEN